MEIKNESLNWNVKLYHKSENMLTNSEKRKWNTVIPAWSFR